MINSEFYPFVQAWISVEKSEQYKEFVLDFLRSFSSTVRNNRKFVTHNYDNYKTYQRSDKFTSHANILPNKEPKFEERKTHFEEKHSSIDININTVSTSNYLAQKEDLQKRKKELILGSKDVFKGIYNNTNSTMYQEVYRGIPSKYSSNLKRDKYSSGIKGVIPDPTVINRLKSNYEISDSLKDTVNRIMFY